MALAPTEVSKSPLPLDVERHAFLLPKVELHAHINGSIHPALLNTFIEERNAANNAADVAAGTALRAPLTAFDASSDALARIADPPARMAFCFRAFDAIYLVMDNLEVTRRAVLDMIVAYAADNTVYLELRTGPRPLLRTVAEATSRGGSGGTVAGAVAATTTAASRDDDTLVRAGMREYIECVLDAIDALTVRGEVPPAESLARHYADYAAAAAVSAAAPPAVHNSSRAVAPFLTAEGFAELVSDRLQRMTVNLIFTLNRATGPATADRIVDLAVAMAAERAAPAHRGARVVGIDFAGNCQKGTFAEFLPALERARAAGLPTTVHAGEKRDDAEMDQMLAFAPARWGHLCFLAPAHVDAIRAAGTPVEFCISSNMLTSNLVSPAEHHLSEWFFASAPVENNTSDNALACLPSTTPAHPFSINTDDRGVFYTSMSREFVLFAELLAEWVTRQPTAARARVSTGGKADPDVTAWLRLAMTETSRLALAHAFIGDEEKKALCRRFDAEAHALSSGSVATS